MAYELPVMDLSLPVAADYSAAQFKAMKLNTSNGRATLCATAGEQAIGILQDDPDTAGEAGSVRMLGISKAVAGAAVTIYDKLTVDSSGRVVTASLANERVIGIALEAASTAGDIIAIHVNAQNSVGASGTTWFFPITLANVADGDVLTAWTPGYAGTIKSVDFFVTTKVTTGSKASTLNLEIGTTNVTGGAVALTSANCATLGAVVAGSAVTAANTFTATDTISIEASSTTAFSEGAGVLVVKVA